MREIQSHKVNPANDVLKVAALDEAGNGGASHEYEISGFDVGEDAPANSGYVKLNFQKGSINEVGVNGITQEALLAIVADRLQGFQSGPFACKENADALSYVEAAMGVLHKRTRERMARGVEGTHKQ